MDIVPERTVLTFIEELLLNSWLVMSKHFEYDREVVHVVQERTTHVHADILQHARNALLSLDFYRSLSFRNHIWILSSFIQVMPVNSSLSTVGCIHLCLECFFIFRDTASLGHWPLCLLVTRYIQMGSARHSAALAI